MNGVMLRAGEGLRPAVTKTKKCLRSGHKRDSQSVDCTHDVLVLFFVFSFVRAEVEREG